jgi:UDP-N-acetylmuramoylalanine-D-glutamate ligase
VPVTWLIGGQSRDVSLAPMAAALAQRRSPTLLLGLPDTGEAWCAQLAGPSGSLRFVRFIGHRRGGHRSPAGWPRRPLAVADVGEAVRIAATRTPEDGVVLFAPGAPTPSRLGTYHERAADFAAAFAALSGG